MSEHAGAAGYGSFSTKEEFYEALRENRDRPAGRAKAAIAEEILDAAEAFGDRGVVVSALVELMSAYHGSGESVKYPVAFARLVRLRDEAPQDFDDWETHQFYWFFKWVTSGLITTPDVPLASIRGWLDEMLRRYRAAGHDLQPVYAEKFALARHLGTGEDLAYDLWATRGRTRLSDCAACEARARARFRISRGEDERALTEMAPTFAREWTCSEEPHTSQAVAMLPLLRLGRLDEARTAHLTGYRAVRGKDAEAANVGLHLEFCAWTRNEARGLELLSQNRGLFGFKGDLLTRLGFLIGVETLLVRLAETGHGDVPCAGPAGREWTVETLRGTVASEAETLAARFDARNGTTSVSDDRKRRISAPVLVTEPLNLGVRIAAAQGSETEAAIRAVAAPQASASGSALVSAPSATPIPDDFADLVSAARALDLQSHPDATRLWTVIAERAAGPDAALVDDLLRGEIAAHDGHRASADDDWEPARASFLESSQWYAKAARSERVITADARAVWTEVMAQMTKPGAVPAAVAAWPRLDELLTRRATLLASIDPATLDESAKSHLLAVRVCRVLIARMAALRAPDHPDHAQWVETFLAECEALLADGRDLGIADRTSIAFEVRSEYLNSIGDLDGAESDVRAAIAMLTELGWTWRLHRSRMLLALTYASRERYPEGVALLQTALAEAHPATNPTELTPLHRLLGDMARESGDAATAVRAYSEAAVRMEREGDVGPAVETRWRMATALMAQGSVADGVAVLETLVDVVIEDEDEDEDDASVPPTRSLQLATQIRLDLAHGLLRIGEPRAAAIEYLRIADIVGGWPDQRRLTYAAACAARALALAGSWDSARAALQRALASNATAPAIAEVNDVLRDLARAVVNDRGAEALDEALGYLDLAERLRTEDPERARQEFVSVDVDEAEGAHMRGMVLGVADRDEEALACFEAAAAIYRRAGVNPHGRFEALRMAAIVEMNALDRVPAAIARLDAAIAEAEQIGLGDAAAILRRLRATKG